MCGYNNTVFFLLVCFHHSSYTTGQAENKHPYSPLNTPQSNKEGSHTWCNKSISSSFCPRGCGHGCMVYFLSCASQSADINKHCHLCISAAHRVCRLFSEGGAYWQNKLCLEIVMLSWSLKVQVIFKSMNLLTRILANWSWAQAQAGVAAAANTSRYTISLFPFPILLHVLLLQNSKVAELLPLGLWLHTVSKKPNLRLAWRRRTTFPEPVVSTEALRRGNRSWSVCQFLFFSISSSQNLFVW